MNKKSIIIMGGLGNQMFQYALYLSNINKFKDLHLDLSWFDNNSFHNGFELKKIFNLNENFKVSKSKETFFYLKRNFILKIIFKMKEKLGNYEVVQDKFAYNKNLLINSKTLFCVGYWQSEKYFLDFEKEVRKVFVFPKITDEKNLSVLNLIKKRETVSIHIRRGDYLNVPELNGLAPIEYYKRAVAYIKERVENPIFVIFSNDIEWCKENFNFLENQVIFIGWNIKENSYKDMQLMSLCRHNIIPNSSFSWWGAWLNKNPKKIVIAPEKWFTDNSELNYEDIIPNSWIKIKNI